MHIYQNQNLYINIHIYPFSSPENACRPVRFLTGALSSLRAAATRSPVATGRAAQRQSSRR